MKFICEFNKKGNTQIKQLHISLELWKVIYLANYDRAFYTIYDVVWNNIRYGLHQHCDTYVYANRKDVGKKMIIGASVLRGRLMKMLDDDVVPQLEKAILKLYDKLVPLGSKDIELIGSVNLNLNEMMSCNPSNVKRSFASAIRKDFKNVQALQTFIDETGSTNKEDLDILHHFKIVEPNIVHTFENCVYQDIHKAYASFMLKVFANHKHTLSVVKKHLEEASKAKEQGNLEKVAYHKAFNNYITGMFAHFDVDESNKKTKEGNDWVYDGVNMYPLYLACVKYVRNKIDKQLDNVETLESNLIYGNTDGFIMQNPNWNNVEDRKEIGEFGTEKLANNKIWVYNNAVGTHYEIIQYFDEKGNKVIKGTGFPLELRKYVDLSKGQVVTFNQTFDELHIPHYNNVEIKKVEIN